MARLIERRLARLELERRQTSAPLTYLRIHGRPSDTEELRKSRVAAALAAHIAEHGEPVGQVRVIVFIKPENSPSVVSGVPAKRAYDRHD